MSNKKEIAIYIILIVCALVIAQHLNVVVSGSMEPVFYRGDIVAVEQSNFLGLHEFNPDDIEVGDIVVYNAVWFPDPVIHRVINISEINGSTYYTIKGDNNNVPDPYLVTKDQITQKVAEIGDQPIIIPKVGYITLWFKGL
ncbi:MAG: signal peptidase I [Methanobrevibacter sp.]|jgi:signal peptidase|nr:signal peptidase I [Methanobrevibacter sp.]